MPNRIRKEFSAGYGNWTAPAGVTSVQIRVIDKFDKLIHSRIAGGATNSSTFSLRRNQALFGTGRNIFGQLGDNTAVVKQTLTPVVGGLSFVSVSIGGAESTHALRSDFAAYSWGIGTLGELGDNTLLSKSAPVPMAGGHSFVKLSTRNAAYFGLKVDGSAWAWGNYNGNGNYGDNTIIGKSSPVAVVGGHSFVDIISSQANIALKADGSVWSWAQNTNGQIGDGTTIERSSPVAVIGGHSFVSINEFSLARKADGSAWSWGFNSLGQIGDGTTLDRSSPVAVTGGHSFLSLGKDGNTTFGLKADGSMWTWGDSSFGVLGDSTVFSKSSPVPVAGGHSFIQASFASSSIFALKADGTIWSWGSNNNGQLGDNSIVNKSSPVPVVGGHSFVAFSVADVNVIALKADGTTWSWGRNASGQLGDSTATAKSSPVLMTGGNIFQSGSQLIYEKQIAVVPGTVYNLNTFVQNINGIVLRASPGNSLSIVIEYDT